MNTARVPALGPVAIAALWAWPVTAIPTEADPGRPQRDPAQHHHEAADAPTASPRRVLGVPASRDGSGTAWLPDTSPMHAVHVRAGAWEMMLHGALAVGFNDQGSTRGDTQFTVVDWLMVAARRGVADGTLSLRAMLSLEPLMGARGYPLLLQSGETAGGRPLVDRQHPHDLFMEAALVYERPMTQRTALQLYLAAAGEPALGPSAFMHRPSAASDPLAPLGHHWQDSTHISYGVATLGVFTRRAKIEASWFNGREPDERRTDFDFAVPDSVAVRLSYAPIDALTLQLSYGHLSSPEALEPGRSVRRITASATGVRRLESGGTWATTLVWGRNLDPEGVASDAVLLETDVDLDGHHVFFGRAEHVRKEGGHLNVEPEHAIHDVASLVLGYRYVFPRVGPLEPSVGARISVQSVGPALADAYGTAAPAGLYLFLRVALTGSGHGNARTAVGGPGGTRPD